ncbi:MAG: hypothetical protein LC104_00760 [Bacteroidales bacterium]|nr:hypothetical protein [Bacteroidales bacterium]
MDTFKEILSFVGAVIGLISVLIPLYARFVDQKKHADSKAAARVNESLANPQNPGVVAGETLAQNPGVVAGETLRPDPMQILNAKAIVRWPAIALIVTGFMGLGFNLFIAGFGFVDEFITPLSTESKAAKAATEQDKAKKVGGDKPTKDQKQGRAGAVFAIAMLLSFAVASAMAIWAGFNMIRLKSYWLSMAGSFAIMPGGCFCFLIGFPVGIWSLFVLLRPKVSSSFR